MRRRILAVASVLVIGGSISSLAAQFSPDIHRVWFRIPGVPVPFMFRGEFGNLIFASGAVNGWQYHEMSISLRSGIYGVFLGWLVLLGLIPGRIQARRRYLRRACGLCPSCAYDLTANQSGVCPECGEPILPLHELSPAPPAPRSRSIEP